MQWISAVLYRKGRCCLGSYSWHAWWENAQLMRMAPRPSHTVLLLPTPTLTSSHDLILTHWKSTAPHNPSQTAIHPKSTKCSPPLLMKHVVLHPKQKRFSNNCICFCDYTCSLGATWMMIISHTELGWAYIWVGSCIMPTCIVGMHSISFMALLLWWNRPLHTEGKSY